MNRDLSQLTEKAFDIVVIGGGIFGVCAAWDAAQRGLSVAMIERDDFGSATSANSYKIVHGGIRYIQHGDVYRVRQSSNERRAFLRIAPHLTRPLPIVIPTYGHGMKGKAVLRVGMGLYDLLTVDRNRGINDSQRKIPAGRTMSRKEALDMFPALDPDGLTGAAMFSDGQMYNPPRLVLAFLQSAVRAGAVAANHVEARGFLRKDDQVVGVRARDVLSGNKIEIRGTVVLNAAGPYAERLLLEGAELRISPEGTYSRDACFVVPRRLVDSEYALAVQGRTRDPEAVLSRGERHLFIAPWRDYTVIGTWHMVYRGHPDEFTVEDSELQRFLDEINAAYPALGLELEDISLWNAGLVPFGDNPEGAEHLRYGHRSRLIDHAKTHSIQNFITLIGVRYTTGRYEAERAINLACRKLGRGVPRSRTSVTPLYGGEIDDWTAWQRQATYHYGQRFGSEVVSSLVHNYGSRYEDVIRLADQDASLGQRIGRTSTIRAQLVHAARAEMAKTLADAVFRRTDLATGEYPGRAALAECSDLLGRELGWTAAAMEHQVAEVVSRFPARAVERIDQARTSGAGAP